MDLNEACWISGTVASGKTTVSNLLADENTLVYHTDEILAGSPAVEKEKYPNLWAYQNEGPLIFQKPVNEIIDVMLDVSKETVDLICETISGLTGPRTVIAEGLYLLPELLNARGITNVCFLINARDVFADAEMDDVNTTIKFLCTRVSEGAEKFGYKIIPVDEEHDVDTNVKLTAEHFSLPVPRHD